MISRTVGLAVAAGAVAGALGVSLAGGTLSASASSARPGATPSPSPHQRFGARPGGVFPGGVPGRDGRPGFSGPGDFGGVGGFGFGGPGFGGPGAAFGGLGIAGGLGGVLHGSGVVQTKSGFTTVTFDRGTVRAVSGSTVTITAADSNVETFTAVAASKILVAGKSASLSALTVGDNVIAIGDKDRHLTYLVSLTPRPHPTPSATPTA